jgi:nucleoside-diphosphate-sugar epimerase
MKVIITGSTGMVGKGVLYECIDDQRIEEILLINRNPLNIENSKVKEVILKDFTDFSPIQDQLQGYDACFHSMGISSAGVNEEKFTELTYTVTESLASVLFDSNPQMIFNYVSGMVTDSSEKGRSMWARVKGRTENMVLAKGFKDAYMFRPGAIIPERGIKSRTPLYNSMYVVMRPFFGLLKKMKSVTTTTNIGKAMINSCFHPLDMKHPEGADINQMAKLG